MKKLLLGKNKTEFITKQRQLITKEIELNLYNKYCKDVECNECKFNNKYCDLSDILTIVNNILKKEFDNYEK